MSLDKLSSAFSRVFFVVSFALLVLAIIEKVANVAGYTVMRSYSAPRLLELSATMMIFVIALLLRQVREAMKQRRTG
jgi:hypothetical protein